MKEFAIRTFTGIGIVLFIFFGFSLHYISFVVTGLIILLFSTNEYYLLIDRVGISPNRTMGIIFAALSYLLSTIVALQLLPLSTLMVAIPMSAIVMIVELIREGEKPFERVVYALFPTVFIVLPLSLYPFSAFYAAEGFGAIIPNSNISFSPEIVIGFYILLWTCDTGAYIIGTAIGRHRLLERVSPKKSVEGFFGGAIFTVVVAWIISHWFTVVSTKGWCMIAVLLALFGTCSDLIESLIKRNVGVKDSSNILPGHGGFLDRFDSSFLSFPVVYTVVLLLQQ